MAKQNVLTRAKKQQVQTLLQERRLHEARELLQQVCNTDRHDIEAWLHLAALNGQLGDFQAAEQCARHAIGFDNKHPSAFYILGMAFAQQGKNDDAITSYQKAVALQPDFVEALINLGNLQNMAGKLDAAIACYEKALTLLPGDPALLSVTGTTYVELDQPEQAIPLLQQAVAKDPSDTESYTNLGIACSKAGQFDEALAAFKQAISRNPQLAQAHYNLGKLYRNMGMLDEAVTCYQQAHQQLPENHDITHNLSLVELLQGKFATAWEHYLARPSRQVQPPARDTLPSDLHDQQFLLLKEQGIGDEIFFLRFADVLKQRGARLTYAPSEKIAEIVARANIIDNIIGADETPVKTDYRLSVCDLPWLLEMKTAEDIPPPLALKADESRRETIQALLADAGPGPYIGVSWRAGTTPPQTTGKRRSLHTLLYKEIPCKSLADTLRPLRATVVVLQRNPVDDEIQQLENELGRKVLDCTDMNDTLNDMLVMLDMIDAYVCVSNTNVHLRAGLGKKCHVLVPHPPEWRWLAEGERSPWFPTCNVYRQAVNGDWANALSKLQSDLVAQYS
jgi:tetratricopeptide (TPR) repeat protein